MKCSKCGQDYQGNFCPNCGTHIEMVQDEHGNYFRGCPTCHQKFNEKPDDYLNYNAW